MNRRQPIIPKIMRKNKLHIWKSFTVVDLCATIAFAIIAILTGWGLSMLSTLARILIGIVVFIMLMSLLLPVKTWDVRVYNKLFDSFKFLASKKHYVYMPTEKGKKDDATIAKIADKKGKHLKDEKKAPQVKNPKPDKSKVATKKVAKKADTKAPAKKKSSKKGNK